MKRLFDNGNIIGATVDLGSTEYYTVDTIADGLTYTAGTLNHLNAPAATSATHTIDTTGLTASDTLVVSFILEAHMPVATWVTGVTVNGNTATIAEYAPIDDTIKSGTGVMTQVCIAHITGESGDTATVVVSYVDGGTQYRSTAVGYVLKGSGISVLDTDIYVSGSSGIGTLTTDVTQDCLVVYAIGLGDETDSVTLDTDMVNTYNEAHPENNARMAGGVIVPTATTTGYTADMNITAGSGEATVVAVSFTCQQVTQVQGNKKNSGVWDAIAHYKYLAGLPKPYRYIRWIITDSVDDADPEPMIQVSEFKLINGGQDVDMSSAIVTNPNTTNPAGEGPDKLVDGLTSTKWLDWGDDGATGNSPLPSTVIFDMGTPVLFDSYDWATANDTATNTNRNPDSWNIQVSNDNVNWKTVHTVTNASAVTTNQTFTGPYII